MKSKAIALGWVFIIALFFSGCLEPDGEETITIASFNIKQFGKTKAGKPDVMAKLAQIITQYDLVAIQEIRDEEETAIEKLADRVSAEGADYDCIIGPCLGRAENYQEQYIYMYRVSTVKPGALYTHSDPGDVFEREPLVCHFQARAGNFSFVLINIHTKPDSATKEINALAQVVLDARAYYAQEDDFIVLGDFNADCAFFDEDDMTCSLRSAGYTWLISNAEDTNIAQSDCTYDRIVVTVGAGEDYTGDAGVFRFDVVYGLTADFTEEVSDHYPVYAVFYVGRDTDP